MDYFVSQFLNQSNTGQLLNELGVHEHSYKEVLKDVFFTVSFNWSYFLPHAQRSWLLSITRGL